MKSVGTTRDSRYIHVAVDTVGGFRPLCRKSDVRAALRVAAGLDLDDVICPRCAKAKPRDPGDGLADD